MWWRKKKMTLKHSLRKLVASWKCLNFVEKSKSKSETNPSHYFDQKSLSFPRKFDLVASLKGLNFVHSCTQVIIFIDYKSFRQHSSFTSYWSLYFFWTETNSPLNIPSAKIVGALWCDVIWSLTSQRGWKGELKKRRGCQSEESQRMRDIVLTNSRFDNKVFLQFFCKNNTKNWGIRMP